MRCRLSKASDQDKQSSASLVLNGDRVDVGIRVDEVLSDTLRRLGHTDVKLGCERGECGSCTVLVGDDCVNSCVMLTALVDQPVTTPSGLTEETEYLRSELARRGGFQCGFCTPGQVAAAAAFLREASGPVTPADVRHALNGNICRCTGYGAIVESVLAAANRRRAS